MTYPIGTGEQIRRDTAAACKEADHENGRAPGWYAEWEARNTDSAGFLTGWAHRTAECTWEPYLRLDYLGVSADPESDGYNLATDVEERDVEVDPLALPDNAHWKGWVW